MARAGASGPKVTEKTIGRALRALVLENELLSVTVLVDQGADIHCLVYKPKNVDVMWKYPFAVREPGVGPPPCGDSSMQWLSHYRGGWQLIFPNFGPPVEYKGAPLPFHGEAARTAWEVDSIDADSTSAQVCLHVELLRTPFRIERVLSLQQGQPVLSLRETITNLGPERMEAMWGHHPAFGAPLLSADSFLDVPADTVITDDVTEGAHYDLPKGRVWSWPHVRDKHGQSVDLSRMPAPGSRHSYLVWLKDLRESWYALTNPVLGLGAGIVWDGSVLPYVCMYIEAGGLQGYPYYGRCYHAMIEPNSSYPAIGLTNVIQTTGTQIGFDPGQRRTVELRAVIYEGSEHVSSIDRQGGVRRAGA